MARMTLANLYKLQATTAQLQITSAELDIATNDDVREDPATSLAAAAYTAMPYVTKVQTPQGFEADPVEDVTTLDNTDAHEELAGILTKTPQFTAECLLPADAAVIEKTGEYGFKYSRTLKDGSTQAEYFSGTLLSGSSAGEINVEGTRVHRVLYTIKRLGKIGQVNTPAV